MELGNLLFGHSRGNHPIDREQARPLDRMLTVLGYDEYGHNILSDRPNPPCRVEPVERDGARILDGHDHLLVLARPYWWGDTETPEQRREARKPNLEIPLKPDGSVTFTVSWYKWRMRDAYSNWPLQDAMPLIRRSLTPMVGRLESYWLTEAHKYDWLKDDGTAMQIRLDRLPPWMVVGGNQPVRSADGPGVKVVAYEQTDDGRWRRHPARNPDTPTIDTKTLAILLNGLDHPFVSTRIPEDPDSPPEHDLDWEMLDRLPLIRPYRFTIA